MKKQVILVLAVLCTGLLTTGCTKKSTKPTPATGALAIFSQPSAAKIFLDGSDTKRATPDTLTGIAVGKHWIELRLQNYADWRDTVYVEANRTTLIHAVLTSTVGSILVSSTPSGATIYLDDFNTQKLTPNVLTNVSVGDHMLKLTLAEHADWVDTVAVKRDSVTIIQATLVHFTGTLAVNSVPPGAAIWIDSVNTGKITPAQIPDVLTGYRLVELKLPGYLTWSKVIRIYADQVTTVNATLTLQCPGGVIGDTTLPPEIDILNLMPGDRTVYGVARNVDADKLRVVLWAKTDIWYVQPLVSNPFTTICAEGRWQNWTHPWNTMVALLVNESYVVPAGGQSREHPAKAPGVVAYDEVVAVADRKLNFSGYSCTVKRGDLIGPGPNYFSDRPEDVWVDVEGLHLRIVFRDGKWYCTEVVVDSSFGYGVYTFQLSAQIDALDFQMVLAGFIYKSDLEEIDVEFSKVLAQPHNAQYVIQPYTHAGNVQRFTMPPVLFSSHRIEWRPDRITFTSWQGHEPYPPSPDSVISSWTYSGPDNPIPDGEHMRFNFWLYQGKPPVSGQGAEVTFKSFQYEP